jgi:hypothetical protein
MAIHDLDIARWLMGARGKNDVVQVRESGREGGREGGRERRTDVLLELPRAKASPFRYFRFPFRLPSLPPSRFPFLPRCTPRGTASLTRKSSSSRSPT